jgi:flagellar hook-length control protein FliK
VELTITPPEGVAQTRTSIARARTGGERSRFDRVLDAERKASAQPEPTSRAEAEAETRPTAASAGEPEPNAAGDAAQRAAGAEEQPEATEAATAEGATPEHQAAEKAHAGETQPDPKAAPTQPVTAGSTALPQATAGLTAVGGEAEAAAAAPVTPLEQPTRNPRGTLAEPRAQATDAASPRAPTAATAPNAAPSPATPDAAVIAAQPAASAADGAAAISPATDTATTPADAPRHQATAPSDTTAPRAARSAPDLPRFVDPSTARVVEQARASIFKQIALRLGEESSELRMRLDPPELGQLDLHLVSDQSGGMRLHLFAERPEVTQALERHLHELQRALAEQGITVSEASIHSRGRDFGARERGAGHQPGFDSPAAPLGSDEPTPLARAPARVFQGTGLDFLV